MEKSIKLEKIQYPDGDYFVKITPEILWIMINNQDKIFKKYYFNLKQNDNLGNDSHKIEINKGLPMNKESVEILENLLFTNKFNNIIK